MIFESARKHDLWYDRPQIVTRTCLRSHTCPLADKLDTSLHYDTIRLTHGIVYVMPIFS